MSANATELAIEQAIDSAQNHGQRITPWIRTTMRSWAARELRPLKGSGVANPQNETYVQLGVLPTPCTCTSCQNPALIFPPEAGAPTGYCICPRCSFKPNSETAA